MFESKVVHYIIVMKHFYCVVRKPLRLSVANMPKCWKTHSLWMATRLWASRRQSMESSWPGWERTRGWWRPAWWQERGWTRTTPRESSILSSPHFMATVSCRRMRATCCRSGGDNCVCCCCYSFAKKLPEGSKLLADRAYLPSVAP